MYCILLVCLYNYVYHINIQSSERIFSKRRIVKNWTATLSPRFSDGLVSLAITTTVWGLIENEHYKSKVFINFCNYDLNLHLTNFKPWEYYDSIGHPPISMYTQWNMHETCTVHT